MRFFACVLFFFTITVAFAQVAKRSERAGRCPSGEPAAFLCNQKTIKCELSASRGCSKLTDGKYYCCKSTNLQHSPPRSRQNSSKHSTPQPRRSLSKKPSRPIKSVSKKPAPRPSKKPAPRPSKKSPQRSPRHSTPNPPRHSSPRNIRKSPRKDDLKSIEDKLRRIKPFPLSAQKPGECKDRANDCARLKSVCDDNDVRNLMSQECAKTCGTCTGQKKPAHFIPHVLQEDGDDNGDGAGTTAAVTEAQTEAPPEGGTTAAPNNGETTTKAASVDCKDKIKNCDEVEDLCNDEDVGDIMLEQCPKTCNRCAELEGKTFEPFEPTTIAPTSETDAVTTEGPETEGTTTVTDETDEPTTVETTTKSGQCADKLPNCRIWIKYGFCNTAKIAWKKKLELCRRSCEWCGVPS